MYLFADDTTICNSNDNFDDLIYTTNVELDKLSTWFRTNKLSLNDSKTNFIIYGTKHMPIIDYNRVLVMNGNYLERVNVAKFLGIYIDEKLSWKKHITSIGIKIAKANGLFTRLRYTFPLQIMKMLYNTLVYPHLGYCAMVWGNAYKSAIKPIITLQKKALRIITFSDYRAASKPLFNRLDIVRFEGVVKSQTLLFMYQMKNNLLPIPCSKYFIRNDNTVYCTRNAPTYKLLPYCNNIRKNAIAIMGPRIWNELPREIQSIPSISLFKKQLKCWIVRNHID
jgi:hypothetical protein